MGESSDDESSDSSNEFLVPADKIDLNSSFFNQSASKKHNPKKAPTVQSSSEDSDDEFDYSNDNNVSSAELLSQVLKNLENAKNQSFGAETNQSEPSTSKAPELASSSNDLSNEINDLLLQGESASTLSKEEDIGEEDTKTESKSDYVIPEKGVQIHLPGQNFMFDKKKKKQQDLQKMLQSKINQRIRSNQIYVHKVGLLCWLSHGFFLNTLANEPELLAISLSLITPNNYPKSRPDLKYIEKFTKWFTAQFKICEKHKEVVFNKELLLQRLADKKIYNYMELILLFIATVRGMGINCRLVISLQPPPLKPRSDQLFKIPTIETKDESNENKSFNQKQNPQKISKEKSSSKDQTLSVTKIVPKNSREALKAASEKAKQKAAVILKKESHDTSDSKQITEDDNNKVEKNISNKSNMTIARKLRLRGNINIQSEQNKSKATKTKSASKSKENESSSEEFTNDESDYSSDDEFIEKKPKKRVVRKVNQNKSTTSNRSKQTNKERKLLSSDDDDQNTIKNVINVWVEVYVESEESWISVDVLDQKIHCVSEIYKKAGNPVLYVIAWNSAGTLKDVTRRYCPHWLTDTRKKRVDEKWWSATLSEWKEKKSAISKAEDDQLLQRELEQPLPKTVSECKGHPLYVLTRHLLKFEALYPPDAVPLGHLKTGEAIYSRHCVHTLMSRETWVKKARVVKPAQNAYKIVKSMPKYDKLSGMKIKDQPLELFGKWQTKPYEPPEAKDGKVPRNEYGNVDLFKMCMLPKGCVYINLPALNRIARKLNIDCAQACIGFNFGCRGALPAFQGFVVCAEYEDTLREAWEAEQVEAHKRAKEKREKRIYGNWKKLIKGLLIREKLAAKYNFGEEDYEDNEKKEVHSIKRKAVTEKKLSIATKKPSRQTIKVLKEQSTDDEEENTKKRSNIVKKTRFAAKIVTKPEIDEENTSEEEVKRPMITEKKSIFKKINAAAGTAKKVIEENINTEKTHDADMKDHANLEKNTIAKKLRVLVAKSSIIPDKEVKEDVQKEIVRPKRARIVKSSTKLLTANESEKSMDEQKEEVPNKKKRIVPEKNATVITTKVATRASKRSKQDPGNAKKKIKS